MVSLITASFHFHITSIGYNYIHVRTSLALDFNEDDFICPLDLNQILDNLTGGTMDQELKNELISYVCKIIYLGDSASVT